MSAPPGYAERPATWDDLDDVAALFRACDVADVGIEDPVREHLEEDWRLFEPHLEERTRLVDAPDGTLAAYASAHGLNPALSVETFVRVHPAHRGRGLGPWLLAWAEERARTLVPDGASPVLRNPVPATDAAAERLLVARGYAFVRVFWVMERTIRGGVEPPEDPAGVTIRAYRHARDADAYYEALEEAFADHWGFEPYPRDVHMRDMERWDPELALVALDGEDVVGGLLSRLVEGTGWIDVLAVRRPWRGRGIAGSLLRRSFGTFAARGAGAVMLNVDAANETGATRLYESAGMTIRRAWHLFERPLDVS